jgi:hypothetical protein
VLTGALSDAAGNLFAGLGFSAAILVVGAIIAVCTENPIRNA